MALPDPNRSLWVASSPETAYPTLAGTTESDVVVVGGGITGLTTALLLAQRGVSVAVLEGSRIAGGTTGYTTAKITSLHSLTYAKLVRAIGNDKARLYGEANEAAIAHIASWVESLAIDCQFTRAAAFTYTIDPGQRASIEEEVDAARSLGLPASYTEETDLPYPVAAAVRFDEQAHFHPRAYSLALAAAFTDAGGRIFEQTRATDIDERDGGVVVETEAGEVRAAAAMVATLLPFLDIGGFFAKAHPSRSYAISVRVRGQVPAGMYLSIDQPTRSVRPVQLGDGAGLILGGSSHKPGDADDASQYYRDLEAWARDTFDVEAIEHRWSAQDYVSVDQVPYIGRCPRMQNVYVGTGFKKWGMTGGTVAGLVIADLVRGSDNPWLEVFDATRIGSPVEGVKKFVKENASVGMHFVKDRIERLRAAEVSALAPGEGGLVRTGLGTVGAYRSPAGDVHAVSVTCTHMGCSLKWNNAETSWDCPCHGSRFTHTGDVIEGPATRPLEQIPIADD